MTAVAAVLASVPAAVGGPARWADVPVVPDRPEARTWAEEELLKREYAEARPGPVRMLLNWLSDLFDRIPSPEGINVDLGVTVAVVLVLLLVGYVLWRTGGVRRQIKARTRDVFDDTRLTAADHRRASDAAEAAGDLRTALLERFRALVRSLGERALLEPSPGLTADELARRAATRLPTLAPQLHTSARAFDDVRYGERPATSEMVRAMRELDDEAARTAPAEVSAVPPALPAVPR